MIYRGKVTATASSGVYVTVTELHPTQAFGPLKYAGAKPATNDIVLVMQVGSDDAAPDLVVLAPVQDPGSTYVAGPASATANALARFDGTTGKLVKNSALTVSDGGVLSGLGTPSASTDAATKGYADGLIVVPVGAVLPYGGSSAPSASWLLCAGQAVSRTTYANLFTALGTTYGTGNGSTTFNLPDLRGRVAAGLDNMNGTDAGRLDWANTLGTTGGAQTHTLTAAESGVPAHSHPITDSGHTHTFAIGNTGSGVGGAGSLTTNTTANTGSSTTGITVNNNTAANASSAHNNMQPTILLNYIIRAL